MYMKRVMNSWIRSNTYLELADEYGWIIQMLQSIYKKSIKTYGRSFHKYLK